MRRALPALLTTAATAAAVVAFPATAAAATNGPLHFGYGYTINPDGTGQTGPNPDRSLYSDYLSFSPDGAHTLYRGQPDAEPGAITTVVVDNPAFTAPTQLVASDELGVQAVGAARWPPDGESIAFRATGTDGSRDIGVIAPDGTGLTWLTVPGHLDITSVSWLPDSSAVVYTKSPAAGEYELCTTAVATDTTSCVALPGGEEHFYDNAGVSPDGETVLLTSQTSVDPDLGAVYDLVRVDIDGTNPVNLTANAAGVQTTSYTWSPDGASIAFSRSGELWTMAADGSGATRLTEYSGDNVAWQPLP
jgi:TolB protein